MRIIAIHCIYYKDNINNSINKLKKILFNSRIDFEILIINNNENIILNSNEIRGSNNDHEFSAWLEGIEYLKKYNKLNKFTHFIFSNDTFCNSEPWTFIDDLFLTYKIRTCKGLKKNTLIGDIGILPEAEMYGIKFNSWVRTHLFVLTHDLVLIFEQTLKISCKKIFLNQNTDSDILYFDKINMVLSNHIYSWIYPKDKVGWNKSKKTTDAEKLIKIQMILNEMYVLVHLFSKVSNINIINTRRSKYFRYFNNFIYKIIKIL
jgi:hypothetical protein